MPQKRAAKNPAFGVCILTPVRCMGAHPSPLLPIGTRGSAKVASSMLTYRIGQPRQISFPRCRDGSVTFVELVWALSYRAFFRSLRCLKSAGVNGVSYAKS